MIRTIAYWILLVVITAFGYIYTNDALFGAGFWAVVLLPPLSLAVSVLSKGKLSVSLRMPSSFVKGQEVKGSFVLRNDSIVAINKARLQVNVHNSFTGENCRLDLFVSVPPKSSTKAEFVLESMHCGYITVTSDRIFVGDIFSVFRIPHNVHASAGMTVLPQTFPLEMLLHLSPVAPDEGETYSQVKQGNDYSELFQLRDYVPGDSLKQVHWKLSAKRNRLIIREASLPLSKSLLVFWDKYPGALPDPDDLDATAEVVVSLCQSLSEQGYSYMLGWSESAEQTCFIEEIANGDILLTLTPTMIKYGGDDEISGTERYLRTFGIPEYTKIIYISTALPDVFEEFCKKSDVSVLLCGSNIEAEIPPGTVRFSAQDYTETMRILELVS